MRVIVLAFALWASQGLAAEVLTAAVASNFRGTLERIASAWEARTGSQLRISSASTGVLYAQALHGAPYDLLLAADAQRPARLVESGHALADSLFTYAYGRLVLAYSADLAPDDAANPQAAIDSLLSRPGTQLALANPELAPYGRAAREVLARGGHSPARILTAANVGQAFQMWHSGGAGLALVAASYAPAHYIEIPTAWYTPIAQQGVILSASPKPELARQFFDFLGGEQARAIIEAQGYRVDRGAVTDG